MLFNLIQPLDLESILLSHLAGSPVMFWIIGILVIIMLGGFFKMDEKTVGIFAIMFTIVSIVGTQSGEMDAMLIVVTFFVILFVAYQAMKLIPKK